MRFLNAELQNLGFGKVKMPYASDKKPMDELARLAEIERRLDIETAEPAGDTEPAAEPDQDQPEPDLQEDEKGAENGETES